MNHQEWEKNWWGSAVNTFGEEYKQIAYAKRMGLQFFHNGKSPFNIDMQNKAVLDIGGGPVSLLLKCINLEKGVVVDPCDYPAWIEQRYSLAGLQFIHCAGEDMPIDAVVYDECWIYNVLQHVISPERVIKNARKVSKIIRLFEWVDCGTSEGHPHELTPLKLNEWLRGEGKADFIDENTARGKCYYGIFKGDNYAKI